MEFPIVPVLGVIVREGTTPCDALVRHSVPTIISEIGLYNHAYIRGEMRNRIVPVDLCGLEELTDGQREPAGAQTLPRAAPRAAGGHRLAPP
eukprot:1188507-Prorocentrum_minimum.AAC.1